MPIPPVIPQHYDNMWDVLNMTRPRLNDSLKSLEPTGGQILQESDAFTHQIAISGWRRVQSRLAELGYTRLNMEIVITGLPVVTNTDPASQTYIDWNGFYDGTAFTTTPALPANMIQPNWVSERQTGMNAIFPATPNMENMVGGLPGWQKQNRNQCWQWRDDKLWMPGSLSSMDLRIGYAAYLPDPLDVGSTRWFRQPIPIMRCLSPYSWVMCFEFMNARRISKPELATEYAAAAMDCWNKADEEIRILFKRDVATNANTNVRRIARNRGANGSAFGGYGNWG